MSKWEFDPVLALEYLKVVLLFFGQLAWPAAIVVTAWIFRQSISRLIDNVRRWKWGENEVEFGKAVAKVEAITGAADIVPALPAITNDQPAHSASTVGPGDTVVPPNVPGPSAQDVQVSTVKIERVPRRIEVINFPVSESDLLDFARVDPRGAILFAWTRVEETLRVLTVVRDVPVEKGLGSAVRRLHTEGHLTKAQFFSYKSLKRLRDLAADDPTFSPVYADVVKYIRSCENFVREFQRLMDDKSKT